jgi:hypothetical protein
METKMHNDEVMEHRKGSGGMEAGFSGVEDSKTMRSVVLKMDVRYV